MNKNNHKIWLLTYIPLNIDYIALFPNLALKLFLSFSTFLNFSLELNSDLKNFTLKIYSELWLFFFAI